MPVVQMIETPLSSEALGALGDYVRAVAAGKRPILPASVAEPLSVQGGPVFVGLREQGRLVAQKWVDSSEREGGWGQALSDALGQACEEATEDDVSIDTVEIVVCHDPRDIVNFHEPRSPDRDWLYGNIRRGVTAVEITRGERTDRISPFWVIARNRGFRKILDEFREQRGLDAAQWQACRIRAWDTHQFLVRVSGSKGAAVPRWRGTSLVDPASVTRESVEDFARLLGDYLFEHVNEEGHLTYLLDPAEGEDVDPTNNNMIRQWMATCAMNRSAAYRNKSRELYAIVDRNIRFNLRKYYRAQGSIGLIQFDHHINLGSVALAAQGLMEHPNRASFARAERKLLNSVQWCWDKGNGTGQFATIIHPLNMDHGNNFYPGEALLTWSMVYRENKDPKLLDQFMKSYRWYRQWHLERENRKPAFVPWHVQAYFNMWELTGNQELADFIYIMSDWLCTVQSKTTVHPDAAGQFYDPQRPHFGTPHSSSTGVYMEGLIDSYELAKRQGDAERRERYREALVRGIRNCMQFTFKDDLECFYGFEPRRLLGGTRTNAFNNRVRCDNVQHNLMGILKVLKRFDDEEFAHPIGPLTRA